jgi:hypothetical protein
VLDSIVSEQSQVACSCEQCDEYSDIIEEGKFLTKKTVISFSENNLFQVVRLTLFIAKEPACKD